MPAAGAGRSIKRSTATEVKREASGNAINDPKD
jgi:hypothetical protein